MHEILEALQVIRGCGWGGAVRRLNMCTSKTTGNCSGRIYFKNLAEVILGILALFIFSASPALGQDSCASGQDSWWNTASFGGGYVIKHDFDPQNPASLSANKFIDNVDYLSDRSYIFEGMVIQAITANSVETNAALFQLTPNSVEIYQKLLREGGKKRYLGRLLFGPISALTWSRYATRDNAVFFRGATNDQFIIEMRLNSDSMLMMRVKTPGTLPPTLNVTFEPAIAATYTSGYAGGNVMHLDDKGGVSLHPIGGILDDCPELIANGWRFRLSNGQNFWVSVFPPKPFDWEKARERLFWEWGCQGDQGAYPSNATIDSVNQTPFAFNNKTNVLLLQGGEYLWQNWNAAFEPRYPTEFSRIITHAHQSNMRVVVYASPFYFTKGHPNFNGIEWQPCDPAQDSFVWKVSMQGENSQTYLAAISKLLNDYPGVDGIYFDEIYPLNLPESYAVIRETRKLLGSDKRIMYHTTQGTTISPWAGGRTP